MQIDPAKNIQVLHKACGGDDGAESIVRVLIEAGADIDCQDNKKWTPLMIAAMQGNYKVVNCLVKNGANMGLEDIQGKTAREYAIEALENEVDKKATDIKTKTKIAELNKIKNLLPDENNANREGEVNDEETPNAPTND